MITRYILSFLLLFCLPLFAAENDITYLQTNSEGKKVERTITITPETVLTVNDQGRIVVLGYPAILAKLDVFDDDSNGLVPMVDGYGVPLEVPAGTAALTPSGWGVVASQSVVYDHVNDTDNPHGVTAAQLGLEDATLLGNPDGIPPAGDSMIYWNPTSGQIEWGVGTATFPWANLSGVPASITDVAGTATDAFGLQFLGIQDAADGRNYIGLDLVENVALSTWGGSTTIDTVGTITSGTWSGNTIDIGVGGTGATTAGDARANLGAAASGANTDITSLSGGLEVTGNLDVDDTLTADTVEIGPTSWSYNPTGSGQLEITFPGGTAAMYETGSPAAPYFYFPGTIYCDILETTQLDATIISGIIPGEVMYNSLELLANWTEQGASTSGITYAAGPEGPQEPTPALATYFPNVYVNDGGASINNTLESRYRTKEQFNADLMPTASAAIDWPSIAAGASSTQTLTVTGCVTTNTPTVTLGWSASLEAGLLVAQARVSAANTVAITLINITGGAIDPASVTVRAAVHQF